MRVAAVRGKRELRVVDFGGSLGSTYFWCRDFFKEDFRLRWHVVEQEAHVKVGRADFQDEELRFDFTVDDVIAQGKPDVLLMSGVLHYLEKPAAFLEQLDKQFAINVRIIRNQYSQSLCGLVFFGVFDCRVFFRGKSIRLSGNAFRTRQTKPESRAPETSGRLEQSATKRRREPAGAGQRQPTISLQL